MKRSYKGFTLIELLVVIAIIGLLSTLAVVALNSARQRSRDAKRVADIRQVQTALELGFSEVGAYPNGAACGTGAEACSAFLGSASGTVLCKTSATVVAWRQGSGGCLAGGTYMGLVPTNPTPVAAGFTNYVYTEMGAGGASYKIVFGLEGTTGQLQAGSNCANPNGIQGGTAC